MSNGWKKTVSPVCISRWMRSAFGSNVWMPWYILFTPPWTTTCRGAANGDAPTYLPLRVAMFKKFTCVRARQNNETAVSTMNVLHRCPCTDDTIRWPKWEIVEILVQRVTRGLRAWIRWFVDQLDDTRVMIFDTQSSDLPSCAWPWYWGPRSFARISQYLVNSNTEIIHRPARNLESWWWLFLHQQILIWQWQYLSWWSCRKFPLYRCTLPGNVF